MRNALEQFGAQRGGRIDRLQGRSEPGEDLVGRVLGRAAARQAAVRMHPAARRPTVHRTAARERPTVRPIAARRDGAEGLPRPAAPLEIRHDSAPISLRSRAIPFLILVLTVPSGTPVRRAISVWVRPVK